MCKEDPKFKVESLAGRVKVEGGFAAGLATCPGCGVKVLIEVENNNVDFDELAEIRERSDGPTIILMAVLFIIFIISMQFN